MKALALLSCAAVAMVAATSSHNDRVLSASELDNTLADIFESGGPCGIQTQQRLMGTYSSSMFACDVPVDGHAGVGTTPVRFAAAQAGATFGEGLTMSAWMKQHNCSSGCAAALLQPVSLTVEDMSCIGEYRCGHYLRGPSVITTNCCDLLCSQHSGRRPS
jgi:hypothetical protein